MTALRVSIAETLSTVSKAKARSATLWGRVEKLRAFVFALHSLVEGKISFNQYKKEVVNDRIKHQEQLEAERLRLEKLRELELIQLKKQQEKLAQERKVREQAERERRKKLESDPKYIERQKEKNLIKKYDIYFYDIADKHRSKLINILKLLDNNQRLSEQDAIWLNSEGRQFFTDELKIKFHRVEADFYLNEYKTTKLHWHAIIFTLI
jgi:putative lipase involved disintegration of autophagic bodies